MTKRFTVSALAIALLAACPAANPGLKNNPNDPNANRGLHVEIVGSTSIVMAPLKTAQVTARLMLGTQPVPGANLTYAMQGSGGGTYLSAATELTNEVGEAQKPLVIHAGPTAAKFVILISAENAEPARLNVDVNGRYAGNVVVRPIGNQLPSDLKIAFLNVRLHDGRGATCDSLSSTLDDAPNGLPPTIASNNVTAINVDARFNGLTDKTKVIATVAAINAVGRAVAVGCGGPGDVTAQKDTLIQVPMRLAEPSIIGKYDYAMDIQPLEFINHDTQFYATANNILNVIEDPLGTFLNKWLVFDGTHTMQKGACSDASAAVQALCVIAAGAFEPILKALLNLDPSETAPLVRAGMVDAVGVLKRVHVGGTLEVKTHDRTTGNITAALGFDTYNFIWRAQNACKLSANPDACCGHYVFDGGSFTSKPTQPQAGDANGVFQPFIRACGAAPAGSFSSPCPDVPGKVTKVEGTLPGDVTYNISVPPADTTDMALQGGATMSLQYGTLLLGVIEGLVLPNVFSVEKIPGTPVNGTRIVKVGDMLRGLLNCNGIAATESQAICQAASAAVNTLLSNFVGALSFNGTETTNARLQITGRFLDNDRDRAVETMSGTVTMIAEAGSDRATAMNNPVEALFSGTDCTSDKGCLSGMACRFAKNPLDNCFAKPYCGVSTGIRRGGESCFQDSECFSGICIDNVPGYTVTNVNRCYQACATDADCDATATCDTTGMLSVESENDISASPLDVVTRAGTCVPRTLSGPTGATHL